MKGEKQELQEREFSLLDRHLARFLVRLSGFEGAEAAHFTTLVQQLSAALDSGDSCVDISGRRGDMEIVQKLPKTLCISAEEYQAGSNAPLVLFGSKLFLYRYFYYEFRLATQLRQMACETVSFGQQRLLDMLFPEDNYEKGEIDWQKKAAELALKRKLAIISGGPGTGKTTTVVKILALLLDAARHKGEALPKIKLVAPTGKAAMRLGKSVAAGAEELAVDGENGEIKEAIPRTAITLHRLLGVRHNSSKFRHNNENPLDCSVVVVDEASMVDLALMSKLVDALPPFCRLILLGDKDQLASVESGAVLAELLASLPECGVQLEKSYRFDKNIKALALAINKGDADSAWQCMAEPARQNLAFFPEEWFSFLAERFLPYMEKAKDIAGEKEIGSDAITALFEVLRSFQILCATRRGRRGVKQVNNGLTHFFMRKNLCQMGSGGWFIGRPVIITSNDYALGLFNGDMGICLPGVAGEMEVWFEHYEKGFIAVPYGRLSDHETAFAITIHKSQGSEFAEVAVLLPEKVYQGLRRELLYTGITRAKEKVWLLAERNVFTEALGRSTARQSGLRELLDGGLEKEITSDHIRNKMNKYYAHSTTNPDKNDWQLLSDHLLATASSAELFASAFNAGEWGKLVGLLHDAGKATARFQQRIEGKEIRVDHSSFGAKVAQERGKKLGWLLAYIIAGHHGGLPDGGPQSGQLHYRLKHAQYDSELELLPELAAELPKELVFPFLPGTAKQIERRWAMFSFSFFTRMLFSCLVDADFLDTEAFCSPERSKTRFAISSEIDFSKLKSKLLAVIEEKKAIAKPGKVNTCRQEILAACLKQGSNCKGFYSLTVPTGGGKTLSSLAFALTHAEKHQLNRIIYTIPFTSIIEQNAEVFCKAVGRENVLEHHSSYRVKDEEGVYDKWRSAATENWDAPIIVTTNVQFFESLFAAKPSQCRKLHNIARSVIVLDEAQAIPTDYLEPCLAVLNELVQRYDCTVVFCTATQPALDEITSVKKRIILPQPKEIIPDPPTLFDSLKRTRIEFIGKLSNQGLAEKMAEHQQVLSIVATKKQAQEVYRLLKKKEGAYHLSTNLYPAHRRRILKEINGRLKEGLSCRIVSTSLIEAGVDIDLPVVYRAMAGLDSIAQAAGRCNREGLLEYGMVYVYEPEEMPSMPWLQRRMGRAGETLQKFPDQDILLPEPMRCYFELLYDVENLDSKNILERLNPQQHADLIFPFKEVARDFKLIEEDGDSLIIPSLSEDRAVVEQLIEELRYTEFPHSALRKLQQFSVSVRQRTLEEMVRCGAVEIIREQYPILCNYGAYTQELGLEREKLELWDSEQLIL